MAVYSSIFKLLQWKGWESSNNIFSIGFRSINCTFSTVNYEKLYKTNESTNIHNNHDISVMGDFINSDYFNYMKIGRFSTLIPYLSYCHICNGIRSISLTVSIICFLHKSLYNWKRPGSPDSWGRTPSYLGNLLQIQYHLQ